MVINIHERIYEAPASEVAALVATLASENDRLWPYEHWPPIRFDQGLVLGTNGGHGPVRYWIKSIDPTSGVTFRFTGPSGFDGEHAFTVTRISDTSAKLQHKLFLRPHGWARLTWPLFFRPMHDALLEEAFDKAARELGSPPKSPYRRSLWVRLLRGLTIERRKRRTANRKRG